MNNSAPLSYRVRAELFTQLAQMETAGLPPDRAFSILKVANAVQPRLDAMQRLLQRSDPATAGERSGLFTPLEAQLVRASLAAGSPANMYQRLVRLYTQRAMQVAKAKSQMMLPGFMLIAALLIAPLPQLAGGTLSMGGFLWGVVKPLLLIGALVLVGRWLITQAATSSAVLTLPLLGKMIVQRNVRDFFESLATLLEAGVSIFDALPVAVKTIENDRIKRDYARVLPRMKVCATLAQALADCDYLGEPGSRERALAFVNTGEASGTLPEMLLRHVTFETDAINERAQQLATWAPRVVYAMVVVWMAMGLLAPAFQKP